MKKHHRSALICFVLALIALAVGLLACNAASLTPDEFTVERSQGRIEHDGAPFNFDQSAWTVGFTWLIDQPSQPKPVPVFQVEPPDWAGLIAAFKAARPVPVIEPLPEPEPELPSKPEHEHEPDPAPDPSGMDTKDIAAVGAAIGSGIGALLYTFRRRLPPMPWRRGAPDDVPPE